jgi:hypothetical protein
MLLILFYSFSKSLMGVNSIISSIELIGFNFTIVEPPPNPGPGGPARFRIEIVSESYLSLEYELLKL